MHNASLACLECCIDTQRLLDGHIDTQCLLDSCVTVADLAAQLQALLAELTVLLAKLMAHKVAQPSMSTWSSSMASCARMILRRTVAAAAPSGVEGLAAGYPA
ncbi:UNVERIFIED_CONTAM: hypothetical protein K2H54_046037, partial [Gekko kuhli]